MHRAVAIVVGTVGLLGLAAAPASAATPHAVVVALLDFPSIEEIVQGVVKFFFSSFLEALVPEWLRDGSVDLIRRLVTVPDPTNSRVWPTLAALSEAMRWIAVPLLSLATVASWTQQWLQQFAGRPVAFEQALTRTALAAILLAAYPTFLGNAVALTNSVSAAMLSTPAAGEGLERTVGLVFAGSLLSGGGLLLALLGIVAVVLAVGLLMMSVGLLVLSGLLYVSAPLAIVSSVVEETHGIWAAWRYTLLSTMLVPVGWCVLFTAAGAFMVDMTRWSGGVAGELGARFVGVLAAIVILVLAVRWPLVVWSGIKTRIAGALATVGPGARVDLGVGAPARVGGRIARSALLQSASRPSAAVAMAGGGAQPRAATAGGWRGAGVHPRVATVGGWRDAGAGGGGPTRPSTPGRSGDGSSTRRETNGQQHGGRDGRTSGYSSDRPVGRAANASGRSGAMPPSAADRGAPAGGVASARPGSRPEPDIDHDARGTRPGRPAAAAVGRPRDAAARDERLSRQVGKPQSSIPAPPNGPSAAEPASSRRRATAAATPARATPAERVRKGVGVVGAVWLPPKAARYATPSPAVAPGQARSASGAPAPPLPAPSAPRRAPAPRARRAPAASDPTRPSGDAPRPQPQSPQRQLPPRAVPARRVRRKWRDG